MSPATPRTPGMLPRSVCAALLLLVGSMGAAAGQGGTPFQQLQSQLDALKQQVAALQAGPTGLQQQVSSLQQQVSALQEQVSTLQAALASQQQTYEAQIGALRAALSGKQDLLTAGGGIRIAGSTISVERPFDADTVGGSSAAEFIRQGADATLANLTVTGASSLSNWIDIDPGYGPGSGFAYTWGNTYSWGMLAQYGSSQFRGQASFADSVWTYRNLCAGSGVQVGQNWNAAGVVAPGTLRWNTATRALEYSDGLTWLPLR